ncbi:MAG: prmB [Gammaproteobacteria bacterium]|nr:prmB [Gammaproteobacteria bacterium]
MDKQDAMSLTTLGDWLQWAEECLRSQEVVYGHGTDNPWDEAVAIARYVLRLPIDIDPKIKQARLTEAEKEKLIRLLDERINERVPVPYLTHEAWFAHLSFFVDKRVLIPRSPLAELIEQRFVPWVTANQVQNICDIGTGSGCIAIACAKAFPGAKVDAVDLSTSALEVAKLNCREHDVDERVQLFQGDLFEPLKGRRYDLIISNPPYVDKAEMQMLPMEYTHEPALALAAGEDGLDIVIRLLAKAADYMTDEGIFIVELGHTEAALQAAFPQVDFLWLEFERGGTGVCLLKASQLQRFQADFNEALQARGTL